MKHFKTYDVGETHDVTVFYEDVLFLSASVIGYAYTSLLSNNLTDWHTT